MSTANPYTPGFDDIPPVFAGRDGELRVFDQVVDDLSERRPAGRNIVLYGPRGNGKTALLNYVHQRLIDTPKVRTLVVIPDEVPVPDDLYDVLLDKRAPSEEVVTTSGGAGLGFAGSKIEGSRQSAKTYGSNIANRRAMCIEEMKEKPTLLMVDEAHRISRESLQEMLILVRSAKRSETNFRFVLAGTPNLPTHIHSMFATYLNRAKEMRMDRLTVESTRTALFQPILSAGYDIQLNEAQRDRLIEQSQCYPHFVQCIGHAIWEVVDATGNQIVDAESVANARCQWVKDFSAMYRDRVRELRGQRLSPYAFALAERFRDGRPAMYSDEVEKVVENCNPDADTENVMNGLIALGYIWETAESAMQFEPGIPSLLDHVLSTERIRDHDTPNLAT